MVANKSTVTSIDSDCEKLAFYLSLFLMELNPKLDGDLCYPMLYQLFAEGINEETALQCAQAILSAHEPEGKRKVH